VNAVEEQNDNEFLHGLEFQRHTLKLLATNIQFATSYGPLLKDDYFESQYLRIIYSQIKEHVFTYETEIDLSSLMVKLDHLSMSHGYASTMTKELALEARATLNSHIKSEQFIIDTLVSFARRQELKSALLQSVDILEKNGNYERVLQLIDEAVSVGSGVDDGMTFDDFYDLPGTYMERYDPKLLIPTGLVHWDEAFDGGMAPGELHVVLAPPKAGKTSLGVAVGAYNVKRGKSVFHVTLELKKPDIGMKYMTNITGMTRKAIIDCPPEKWKMRLSGYKKKTSNLYIQYWTEKTVNALVLRSWISRIRSKTGIKPDLIIVDYDDLLNPVAGTSDSMYDDSGNIYSDLIGLADYFACPVLTFSQGQRESWDLPNQEKCLQASHLAHSSKKAHKCYSISTLNFKDDSDNGILFADLVRRGTSKVKIKIRKDLSRSMIIDTGVFK